MTTHPWLGLLLGLVYGLNAALGAERPAESHQTDAGGFTGPTSLTVSCGELLVRFDGPKLWTLSRIEAHGRLLAIEDSAYGSVFNLDQIGFIGSAHREVETEAILDVRFLLDDKLVPQEATKVSGESFRCERRSRIRDLGLESTVELRSGQLRETVRVTAKKDVRLEKAYHFMHAWTPKMTHYLYGRGGEVLAVGTLNDTKADERKFFDRRDADWVAVYSATEQAGAVSRLLAGPAEGATTLRLWNVPDVYRKFYLMCFADAVLPAGFDGTYRMTTGFFQSPPETWREAAEKLGAALAEPES